MKYRIIGVLFIAMNIMGCKSSEKMNFDTHSISSGAINKLKTTKNMENSKSKFSENDIEHLKYCLALAEEALKAGDEPFGSILVNENNEVIAIARNRVNEINALSHPEIELANWAAVNLSEKDRKNTTMYTSGEHCPMCAAAHAWVELGGIVYLSSAAQLGTWLEEVNAKATPINFIPVEEIIKNISVKGPFKGELLQGIKDLQIKYHNNN
ncbi:nucleoside deaminase [Salegentibacter salegens]|uniref:tRNA(Arg) A34 adenosine deaminase TadA n=1 Tax=Salegentibacter salegens TaxID=143223 RepID=A0A1M7NNJ4_9FLAO|nr:nucleoside deaminase [Salegentibacter salegens]PRX43085.1 tRNA(Arg) A34 adenosine deaminase TadA [Salegentibacter salegens]SHN05490.1 tRNA(Arg) A34 adenosine deaminase TadA [Salegentibacter salegens]